MNIYSIIAISSRAGTVRAGLEAFKSLFERAPVLKQELDIKDSEIETIVSASDIMRKVWVNARNKI